MHQSLKYLLESIQNIRLNGTFGPLLLQTDDFGPQTFKIAFLGSNFNLFCKSDVPLNFDQVNAYIDIKFNDRNATCIFII